MATKIERASRVLPGGVNSPVRAFRGVGGDPVFIESAEGPYLVDGDGRRYLDFIGGYGPMILGHGHPAVVAAVQAAAAKGQSFGAPTEAEVELGEQVLEPLGAEMIRFVSSGTEATMSALRLARAATGRDKVLKFIGCYHGHADPFLVAAGSGAMTIGAPSSPGIPAAVTASTLLAHFNDIAAVERIFEDDGEELAAVIVEPVAGNMGLVPPDDGFLERLRELSTRHGALLVFDEVMTGFRVAWGGVETLTGIRPDLTTLAKVIGGGLPIGAYAGSADLMNRVAPAGDVYQAGTLSGNPVAVAAGRTTLEVLAADGGAVYGQLERSGEHLESGIAEAAHRHGVECRVQRRGSMLGLFFSTQPVRSLDDVDASDRASWVRLFHSLLAQGVHLPPSPYETLFLSAAHGDEHVEAAIEAFDRAFTTLEGS